MRLGNITEAEILKQAQHQYENETANITLDIQKTALLVIDMQDEFIKPHWTHFWIPQATRIVPTINQIIKACRNTKIPIIFTVYSKTHNYLDRPHTLWNMPSRSYTKEIDQSTLFQTGTIWKDISQEKNDIIIHKSSYGAFFDTPLETILKNLNKDTVIITGTLTNFCCSMTARQAYERGFNVIFTSDATATHFPDMQEYELKILRRGFAKIMTTSEILHTLTKDTQYGSN